MEKDCLVPVSTKPAANLLLETFSRENSAAPQSKKNTKTAGINKSRPVPKIGECLSYKSVALLCQLKSRGLGGNYIAYRPHSLFIKQNPFSFKTLSLVLIINQQNIWMIKFLASFHRF